MPLNPLFDSSSYSFQISSLDVDPSPFEGIVYKPDGNCIIQGVLRVKAPTLKIAQEAKTFWEQEKLVTVVTLISSAIIASIGLLLAFPRYAQSVIDSIFTFPTPFLTTCWTLSCMATTSVALAVFVYFMVKKSQLDQQLTFWQRQLTEITTNGSLPEQLLKKRKDFYETFNTMIKRHEQINHSNEADPATYLRTILKPECTQFITNLEIHGIIAFFIKEKNPEIGEDKLIASTNEVLAKLKLYQS